MSGDRTTDEVIASLRHDAAALRADAAVHDQRSLQISERHSDEMWAGWDARHRADAAPDEATHDREMANARTHFDASDRANAAYIREENARYDDDQAANALSAAAHSLSALQTSLQTSTGRLIEASAGQQGFAQDRFDPSVDHDGGSTAPPSTSAAVDGADLDGDGHPG